MFEYVISQIWKTYKKHLG